MGEGCYHICPNSTHYYSPEQERADDAFYGDDYNREAYGGDIDPEYEMFCANQADAELAREREPDEAWVYIAPPPLLPGDDNDIPF